MKRKLLIGLGILAGAGLVIAWLFLGSATGFRDGKKYLYISSRAATKASVLDSLQKNDLVSNTGLFNWLASRMDYWSTIKPGRYEIQKGSSILAIVRKLRNGVQDPVNLTITKIRTKGDLARIVGRRFECDSAEMIAFLNNPDSLDEFNRDPETAMAAVLPDTYSLFWNTTPKKIYAKLADEAKRYWTEEREAKARAKGISPTQAYIVASIVEEETNHGPEKGNVASVYLNRVAKGMPLQADPTVKFALQDFGLKRIYQKHTQFPSPYNTYQVAGLPPGPICTPSKNTIDAVLNAPQTDYLYFVASSAFNGTHVFTTNYQDHLRYAREYQEALNRRYASVKGTNERK